MAQTERDPVTVRALLADNISKEISPQDLRDAFASTMGYGSMVLSVAGAPSIISATTSFQLVDVFDTILTQSESVNTGGINMSLSPSRITIGTTGVYSVTFFASFGSSANNKLVTFRPHVDGVPSQLIEADRFIGAGDAGSVMLQSIVPYTAGQYGDIRVRIDTGTSDLDFLAAGLAIHRVG